MFSGCTALQTVKIAEGVSSIEDLAFENCSALSNVNFPASITKIGKQAFDNCDALTEITLPSKLSTLEAYAFRDCDGLEAISIPGSLDTICFYTFSHCNALKSVNICEGVTTIEGYAFADCKSLSSVSLPASITEMGDGIFLNCIYLDNIYYGGNEEQWAAISTGSKNSALTEAAVSYESVAPDESSVNVFFTDVAADAYYYKPVQWAVAKAVTNGTSATAFSPDMTCTNAHILTFMWRAAESPEPAISNPFSNLKGDEYYYKAALWAYERDMVNGTVFEADKACTRAMTVQYFWKQAGSPKVFVFMNFADVPADADYAAAVSWAVAEGITNGTSGTTFSPDDICTRAQIVTFLYRALVGE